MTPIAPDILQEVISILAIEGISDEEVNSKVVALVSDPMTAQRLIDWIPEAFALAFISHIAKVQLPAYFSARTGKGRWRTFAMSKEPIFLPSFQIASQMCHDGPREILQNVSMRSSYMDAVNTRLAAGGSLDGAVLSGVSLLGIPAELYQDQTPPFWRRWFGCLVRLNDIIPKLLRTALLLVAGCTPNAIDQSRSPSQLSDPSLNQSLAELFRSHHVQADIAGEWITFPGLKHRIAAVVVREFKPAAALEGVQLDIRLELPSGQGLIESFAGVGESKDKAIADAFHSFVVNSFHVLLRAFFVSEDDQVTVEDWNIDGKPRTVVIGNIGTRGQSPLVDRVPIEWYSHVEAKLKSMPLASGTHWVRIYYAQMNHQLSSLEVLLDNDDWQTLKESLADTDWPKGKDFFSVRVFMVILDN